MAAKAEPKTELNYTEINRLVRGEPAPDSTVIKTLDVEYALSILRSENAAQGALFRPRRLTRWQTHLDCQNHQTTDEYRPANYP